MNLAATRPASPGSASHRIVRLTRRAVLPALLAGGLLVTAPSQAIPPGGAGGSNKAAKAKVASSVKRGGTIRVSGTGFPKGRTVTVKLDDSTILATFRIRSTGSFSGRVPIPRSTRVGKHWLRFLAPSPSTSVKRTFQVRR